jgi:hypothetical protein
VCRKCLSKDPAGRYASARELGADLAAFLDGRAVGARPLNRAQKLGRWVRREPRLAGLAALLLASLATGLGATALQWQRAEANAQASNERLWEGRREAAVRLQQSGNGFEAASRLLLNIAERERTSGPASALLERGELGVLLGQGVTLIDSILIADANPLVVEISPDGRTLAVGLNDSTVRWFGHAHAHRAGTRGSHRPADVGRVSEGAGAAALRGRPQAQGHARVVQQPAQPERRGLVPGRPRAGAHWSSRRRSFADLADSIYSADGDYALLRNTRSETQLWQVHRGCRSRRSWA